MSPSTPVAESGVQEAAALQLRALQAALAALAQSHRKPDLSGLDAASAEAIAALAERIDPQAAAGRTLEKRAGADGRHLIVLAKADRHKALRAHGGEVLAAALLRELRTRLKAAAADARIGRVGGGMVEACFELSPSADLEAALTALHADLERPFTCGGERFTSAIVLGVAEALDGEAVGETLSKAEQALVRAETSGAKFAVYCEEEKAQASERLALMRDLRASIEAAELSVVYQPKLNLRTGEIDGAEALLRWTHPDRGSVSPDRFIELAEDTGDIAALTEHVLLTTVRDQARLAEEGMRLPVNVNLSGRLLADERFCRQVMEICAAAQAPIGLEITETAVIAEPERSLRNLHAFVDAGLCVAIDDYGSGLSSLAYLKMLPATELKIDKAFVLGLSSSHRDPLIIRSTIDLAHALEMEVTAEGVDDPAALALLRIMGCDRAQGFHVSRPLAIEALAAFLKAPVPASLTAPALPLSILARAG